MKSSPLKKILYVEDEDDVRLVGEMALQIGHYEVVVCSSGVDALSDAKQHSPDLIILDVMMPGMDGPSTLRALRKEALTQHIPIIFMTAKIQAKEIEEYKKMGAIGVISKPFDPMNLASEVEILWASR